MAEHQPTTITRPDDRRLKRRRGATSDHPILDSVTAGVYRLDFHKPDEAEAYYAAKALRRLSPQQCKRVRQLIEKTLTATTKAQAAAFLRVLPLMLWIDNMTAGQRIDLLRQIQDIEAEQANEKTARD